MGYPSFRPRRTRLDHNIRRLVRENRVSVDDLIYPLFVCPGEEVKEEIPSMPDNYHLSLDNIEPEIEELLSLDIPGVILFGIPESKDEVASRAYAEDGIVQKAVRKIKELTGELTVMTDVCLCQYTSHGHCGIIEDGYVQNDESVKLLAKTALSHARAGADIVAPSDMMDGRVQAIRSTLDEEDFTNTLILSYAAKYCSAFYGPFRDAAHSAPESGDRKSYQMDPANSDEAIGEVFMDLEEGADMVMVKPALPYLDIIQRIDNEIEVPLAAYNVSGEYSMIRAGADRNWLDYEDVMLETLLSIKRAGADIILTYFAKDAAKLLNE